MFRLNCLVDTFVLLLLCCVDGVFQIMHQYFMGGVAAASIAEMMYGHMYGPSSSSSSSSSSTLSSAVSSPVSMSTSTSPTPSFHYSPPNCTCLCSCCCSCAAAPTAPTDACSMDQQDVASLSQPLPQSQFKPKPQPQSTSPSVCSRMLSSIGIGCSSGNRNQVGAAASLCLFLWRFSPDITACVVALMLAPRYNTTKFLTDDQLYYVCVPLGLLLFLVLAFLQEPNTHNNSNHGNGGIGSTARNCNFSISLLQSWPMTTLGYCSYALCE